jgi:hypothetical protein
MLGADRRVLRVLVRPAAVPDRVLLDRQPGRELRAERRPYVVPAGTDLVVVGAFGGEVRA